MEESIDRVYSPEEVARYITFAKQFKPQIGKVILEDWRHILVSAIKLYHFVLRRQQSDWCIITKPYVKKIQVELLRIAGKLQFDNWKA